MNEFLFALQVFAALLFVFASLWLGRQALIAMAAIQSILANLFVVKQMEFFHLTVTCSDVFAVGGILTLNLLQEYFGREAASQAVKVSFWGLLFFVAMSQIHLLYAPSAHDATQGAFEAIFASTPRIVLASVAVFYIVQKIDIRFFGWLQRAFPRGKLPFRMAVSLVLSQFLDTVMFSFAGLYGWVASIGDVVLATLVVKYCVVACSSPLVAFSRRFVRDAGEEGP